MVVMGSFSLSPLLPAAPNSNMRLLRGGGCYVIRDRKRFGGCRRRLGRSGSARSKKRLVVGSGQGCGNSGHGSFCRADSVGRPPQGRLVAPSEGGLGGRIVWRWSTSRFEISCSICALNSLEARLNSFIYFPTWRAISGNFLGPKMMSAKKNRKIVSEKLMRFIILPEPEKRQCVGDTALTVRIEHSRPGGRRSPLRVSVSLLNCRQGWARFAGSAMGRCCPVALFQSPPQAADWRRSVVKCTDSVAARGATVWHRSCPLGGESPAMNERRHSADNNPGRTVSLEEMQCPYQVFPAAVSLTPATR